MMNYNLILLHTPKKQDISDFLKVSNMILKKAPNIQVFVFTLPVKISKEFMLEISKYPTLIFSPMFVTKPRPLRGNVVCCPKLLTKYQEYKICKSASLPVPMSFLVQSELDLEMIDLSKMVVTKPNIGLRGLGVNLISKSELLGFSSEELRRSPSFNQGMVVQEYIDTGDNPSCYRVMTVLGEVIYCIKSTSKPYLENSPEKSSKFGKSIAVNASKHRESVEAWDKDVIQLASKASKCLDFTPVMGIDMVRDRYTNELYILELNSYGSTWHISSDRGKKFQQDNSLNHYIQFDALETITNSLINLTLARAI